MYQAAFRRFYTAVGKQDLAARVDRWSAVLDVEPAAVRVLDLKNRWGSCSPKGAVNFHWRTLMAPPRVIDYLVVHELAHLRVPDHSRGFWRLVEGVMPDHAERHAWLREHGAEMDL
jgi:predicted metal-dependent hydrolase